MKIEKLELKLLNSSYKTLQPRQKMRLIVRFCLGKEKMITELMEGLRSSDHKLFKQRLDESIKVLATLYKHKGGWGFSRHAISIFSGELFPEKSGFWTGDPPEDTSQRRPSLDQQEKERDPNLQGYRPYYGIWP